MSELFRTDGALIDAMAGVGAIANSATGLGTSRDKSTYTQINRTRELERYQLEDLYRQSRIIQKIVGLLPQDACKKWGELQLPDGQAVDTAAYFAYEKRLGVRKLFAKAGRNARHHGDYFLVLGVDDGLLWDEPIDLAKVRSLKWIKPLTRYDLQPDNTLSYDEPEFYRFSLDRRRWPDETLPMKIHASRVLRFSGVRLSELALEQSCGYNDSVIQAMYYSYSQYLQAIGASSAMIQDYSVFAYGLDGLSQMMSATDPAQRSQVQESLMHRFLAIQMGMSNMKGLMYDKERECAEFIQRSFGGVDTILDKLLDVAIMESGYPRTKLLGASDQGAFSESGKSDRYEWADLTHTYQTHEFQPNLDQLIELIFAAKDGPTRGRGLEGWEWRWHDTLQLTLAEQAELAEKYSKSDAIAIRMKVLHPAEVRQSRYGNAEYGYSIALDERYDALSEEAGTEQPTEANSTQPDLSNLDQLRADAAEGLVPIEEYWVQTGLDVEKMRSLTGKQRRGYWDTEY